MGTVEDFTNFVDTVIDEKADNIKRYIDNPAKAVTAAEIWVGGKCDKKRKSWIQPTVIGAKKPDYVTMCEEIFGPVLTVYIYPANKF